MVKADKIKIIQDLQCRLATWLTKLNKSISLAKCTAEYNSVNVQVTSYIEVLYNYRPFDEAVTNADIVTITSVNPIDEETVDIVLTYDGVEIANYSGSDELSVIIEAICSEINQGTETHGYYCLIAENLLYLYTYDVSATYTDIPVITLTESYPTEAVVSVSTTELDEYNLEVILDSFNCITLTDFCTIVCKIKTLLTDCNCN